MNNVLDHILSLNIINISPLSFQRTRKNAVYVKANWVDYKHMRLFEAVHEKNKRKLIR